MRPSQIQAVDHIRMQAHPQASGPLIRFYRDLAGLELLEAGSDSAELRFRSGQIELRIALLDDALVEAAACRAVVSVHCLDHVADILEAERIEFQRLSGMNWTDRRLSLLDPGGNRVELKQEWRPGVCQAPPQDQDRRGSAEFGTADGKKTQEKR